MNVTTAPGSSLEQTEKIMEEIDRRISTIPQIRAYTKVSGYGLIAGQGPSYGMFIIKLKEWAQRPGEEDKVTHISNLIMGMTADIKDAQVFAIVPPMISGYGTSNGFEMHVQDFGDGDINSLYDITMQFIGALNQRPEIGMAYTTYNVNFPQYVVDIDAAKCKRAGLSPTEVLSVLSGYYGGQYVSTSTASRRSTA